MSRHATPWLESSTQLFALFNAALISSARTFGLFSILPLVTAIRVPNLLKLGISLGLSTLVIQQTGQQMLAGPPLTSFDIAFLLAKEIGIGLVLGALLGVPFWSLQAAGDILDLYRGAGVPNYVDPLNAGEATTLGSAFGIVAAILFIQFDGLRTVLGIVVDTYVIWPPLRMAPHLALADLPARVGPLLFQLSLFAFVIVGPLMVVLLCADLLLVFGARGLKGFQLTDLSVTLKNLLIAVALPIFFAFLGEYVASDVAAFLRTVRVTIGLP